MTITTPVPAQTPRRVLFPGSFDPFTNGHLEVLVQALRLWDFVHILVAVNPYKTNTVDVMFRVQAIRAMLDADPRLKDRCHVAHTTGLIADEAQTLGITHIVRGIRNAKDAQDELLLASANQELATGLGMKSGLQTILIPTTSIVSSSYVRALIPHHLGLASSYVPSEIYWSLVDQYVADTLCPLVFSHPGKHDPSVVKACANALYTMAKTVYSDRDPLMYHTWRNHILPMVVELNNLLRKEQFLSWSPTLVLAVLWHDWVQQCAPSPKLAKPSITGGTWEQQSVSAMYAGMEQCLPEGDKGGFVELTPHMTAAAQMIKLTAHTSQNPDFNTLHVSDVLAAKCFLDADLAVLASRAYATEYYKQIAHEYMGVIGTPPDAYVTGRRQFLDAMQGRAAHNRLYWTGTARAEGWTQAAQTNMEWEHKDLQHDIGNFVRQYVTGRTS